MKICNEYPDCGCEEKCAQEGIKPSLPKPKKEYMAYDKEKGWVPFKPIVVTGYVGEELRQYHWDNVLKH